MNSSKLPDNWHKIRRRVYSRDNYTCQICSAQGGSKGDTVLDAHHIKPRSEGGSHALSNLVTLCVDCHNRQHPHDIKENRTPSGYKVEPDQAAQETYSGPRGSIRLSEVSYQNKSSSGDSIGSTQASSHPNTEPQNQSRPSSEKLGYYFLIFPFKHIILPLIIGVTYLYVLSSAADLAGSIHWTFSSLVAVILATLVGVIGTHFSHVVFKSYALLTMIIIIGTNGQENTVSQDWNYLISDSSLYEIIIAVPALLFAIFGPLIIIFWAKYK